MRLKKPLILMAVLCSSFSASSASAASSGGEEARLLSVGAGIASPSFTSTVFENPAALFANRRPRLLGHVATPNSNFNPLGYGGLLYLGNGSIGAVVGAQTFDARGGSVGSLTQLEFGLGAEIRALNMSLGASGSYDISGGTGNYGINAGMILNYRGNVRFGATAFGLQDNVSAVGVGLAATVAPWLSLAGDASFVPNGFKNMTLKPGLAIHVAAVQFSLGYGINIDNSPTTSWISRGTSLGLGIQLGQSVHLQGYYNQLANYYMGLAFRL